MRIEEAAGEVDGESVGEMTAFRQAHSQDLVTGIDKRQVCGQIRVRAGVGLNVDMLRAEELLRAIDRQRFDHIDVFASAVIALSGISLRVFVGQHAADRSQHGGRDEVL